MLRFVDGSWFTFRLGYRIGFVSCTESGFDLIVAGLIFVREIKVAGVLVMLRDNVWFRLRGLRMGRMF